MTTTVDHHLGIHVLLKGITMCICLLMPISALMYSNNNVAIHVYVLCFVYIFLPTGCSYLVSKGCLFLFIHCDYLKVVVLVLKTN